MLHGHSHGSLDEINETTTRLDVGVDARYSGYMPLSYEQIRSIMRDRKYAPVDHHKGDL
jgi:calcineurin-like phosphoesterase family protein